MSREFLCDHEKFKKISIFGFFRVTKVSYIQYTLDKTGGKMGGLGGAAELLGMKRTSLYARMKKLGLSPKQWRSVFE